MAVSYNNRRFRTIQNAESGDIRIDTIFQYHQKNNVVWAEYDGGSITWGLLIATVSEKGELDMRYAHVNAAGQLKTGSVVRRQRFCRMVDCAFMNNGNGRVVTIPPVRPLLRRSPGRKRHRRANSLRHLVHAMLQIAAPQHD